MKKYPINSVVIDVEALGGEIKLSEFTQEYRVMIAKDPTFDTHVNGLINAGLTKEQCMKLTPRVLKDLYQDAVELTYADELKYLQELKDAGQYVEPTKDEIEESKKN